MDCLCKIEGGDSKIEKTFFFRNEKDRDIYA